MKRCPTCNQTFEEDWLSFCTNDGSALVDAPAPSREPPPTIRVTPRQTDPAGQPTFDLPGSYNPPAAPAPRQPPRPAWQAPPPPPAYRAGPQQGLAIASLVVGLFSVTIGWCYVGLVSGPVAVALGIAALVQAKNKPNQYGGKPLAIVGIITGALPFLGLLLFIVLAVIMQSVK